MANPYERAPLWIAELSPATGRCVRACALLGPVPRAVLAAARRARVGAGPCRPAWTAADAAVLRGFYGAHWRELLAPREPPAHKQEGAEPAASGGAEAEFPDQPDFGDLGAFVDAETPDRDTSGGPDEPGPGEPGPDRSEGAGRLVFSDFAAYPEDTLLDLRMKAALALGIPFGRQHFFYCVNEGRARLPYRLRLDGVLEPAPSWLSLVRAAGSLEPRPGARAGAVLAGVPVEARLEEQKLALSVEALDTEALLAPGPGERVSRAFVVDLYAAVPPAGEPGSPPGLAAALSDQYRFDLLYYGGLLRFWPQLSPGAARHALAEPRSFAAAFPRLAPSQGALRRRFEAERPLAERALRWREPPGLSARAAVTAAALRAPPPGARSRLAVRNIFDWIATGPALPAARVRFQVEAVGAGLPSSHRVSKRHASSFAPGIARATEAFLARRLGDSPADREAAAFLIAAAAPGRQRPGDPRDEHSPAWQARLSLAASGRLEVAATWREDERVSLAGATDRLVAAAAPVLRAVGAMGAAACPLGGPAPTADSVREGALGAITASVFWPHALTAESFRELKARFRAYEEAGIVGVRGLQQSGAYAFFFRKGVLRGARHAEAGAPERRAEDAAQGSTEPAPFPGDPGGDQGARREGAGNQYAWASDAAAAARWASANPGRAVRLHHRATDLRLEVAGAESLREFALIRRYVFSFLDGLLSGPNKLKPADAPGSQGVGSRLKRLQERDPTLFDLRRHDPASPVYSVLCQAGRQPLVHSPAEAQGLPAPRRAALTRYWNFTEREPAFYECPSPRYPHLSLRAGAHPLGFCLPCCKKARAPPASRAAQTHSACLASPAGAAAAPAGMSRHVLSYGKALAPWRVGELPRDLREALLGAAPPGFGLYLQGVEQSVPAVPAAGFAFALARAAAPEGEPAEVFGALAALAARLGDGARALGGGAGGLFASAQDLAGAIHAAFVQRDAGFSPFGPGGAAAAAWPALLADLARQAFGLALVTAADPEGSGAVTLSAAPEALAALFAGERLAVVAESPGGTYPLALLDPRIYLRTPTAQRWMAARAVFGIGAPERPPGAVGDGVAQRVREAFAAWAPAESLGAAPARREPGRSRPPIPAADVALLARFAATGAFQLVARLADLQGRCYGALLREGGAAVFYPVRLEACPADGIPVVYGARPAGPYPRAALWRVVGALNAAVARQELACAPVAAEAALVDGLGRSVGFVQRAAGEALYFFHDAVEGAGPARLPGSAESAAEGAVRIPYDCREIDEAIMAARRAPPAQLLAPREKKLAEAAAARGRLYQLFRSEFAAALREERNGPLRQRLAAAFRAADLDRAAGAEKLRAELRKLLAAHPGDLRVLERAVAAAAERTAAGASREKKARPPLERLSALLDSTSYGFDQLTLAEVRAAPDSLAAVAVLKRLMEPRLAEPGPAGLRPPPNMPTPCASAEEPAPRPEGPETGARGESAPPRPHCEGRRLVVPRERREAFFSLLAADARSGADPRLFAAPPAFDPRAFIRRPGEWLAEA